MSITDVARDWAAHDPDPETAAYVLDILEDAARAADVDVYLTADLRHHPASEHLEGGRPALLCGSHWATESPWLPILARRIRAAASTSEVELRVEVSTIVTEPWTSYRVTQGGLA